jgi:hypothetical protein
MFGVCVFFVSDAVRAPVRGTFVLGLRKRFAARRRDSADEALDKIATRLAW